LNLYEWPFLNSLILIFSDFWNENKYRLIFKIKTRIYFNFYFMAMSFCIFLENIIDVTLFSVNYFAKETLLFQGFNEALLRC
jgi:hypothetical protein